MSAYRNYLEKINSAFDTLINEIDVIYNFDHGDEFEIVLCKALRKILPNKYGIVRGHVITKEGNHAGDDIIIYDCVRFPSLRLLENDSFGQKQFIPIEAVYAYIEAKNTLYPNDTNGGFPNFHKACRQVHNVKSLSREPVLREPPQEFWPETRNPIYGVVWSKNLAYSKQASCEFTQRHKEKSDSCCLKSMCCCKPDEFGSRMECCSEQLHESLEDHCSLISGKSDQIAPDLIVAGSNYVAFPCINMSVVYSPFFIKDKSLLTSMHCEKKAFGIGVTNLLWALDSIELGNIDWSYVLSTELPKVKQPPSRT
ncbi:DUF6602 domain-containing protein [Pseudoalteromonas sp. MMG007]|uniref:DUF6602 domain-containing protein n=1 Tax=Pseudoalteromonas sp. MMG007 TaxID=2822684 RepID=UPI001B371EB7|nr:DUF6602 domain-containing protein [Pseudoalteromonas sp. MMG007]MBQ4857474.1 hypothetical protein [Pseudoalteromonas sp. MMG007]